jgi:coproporphyrinogen III oxidase-like Fe-S oxidoreductase
MMIALRKNEGFSTDYIKNVFGEKYLQLVLSIVPKYLALKQLATTATGFALTKEAKFFADGIASDFFCVNE